MTRRRLLPLVALAVFAVLGCRRSDSTAAPRAELLRVSMIPTTDPGKILRESQALVLYLEKATGRKVELTVPTSYAAVVEALANEQVDIAYLGGFTFVQAEARAGAEPLVQRERDQSFHSLFLTAADSSIRSLADLKGRGFAFGDVSSTSGHLMPAYYMRRAGVDPEVLTKAIYTGGHDATALAVANHKVDAGALDESVYERMVKEGKLDPSKVRIFHMTPPFFDYVWTARKTLEPAVKQAFTRAFLELDASDPEKKKLLELLAATKYVKAERASYDALRQAARDEGMLR